MRISFDLSELEHVSRQLNTLPEKIRNTALRRANHRTGQMAKTAVLRIIAAESGMRMKDLRSRIHILRSSPDEFHAMMRSGWISLIELGASRQTKTGVWVRGWGSHRGAFFAYGRSGIYRRTSKARFPIKKLWGPNPVRQLERGRSRSVWMETVRAVWPRRILHEISRLLG